jgi:hypothetical protein
MTGHATVVQVITDHSFLNLESVISKKSGECLDFDRGGVGDHTIKIKENGLAD